MVTFESIIVELLVAYVPICLSLQDLLDSDIPARDKINLVATSKLISDRNLHQFACIFVERALVAKHSAAGRWVDPRAWKAIQAKREWINDKTDDLHILNDLFISKKAARTAAFKLRKFIITTSSAAVSAAHIIAEKAFESSSWDGAVCAAVEDAYVRGVLWNDKWDRYSDKAFDAVKVLEYEQQLMCIRFGAGI